MITNFSLAWYGNIGYRKKSHQFNPLKFLTKQAFSKFCYNGPSCKSKELNYILKKTFINTTQIKHTEVKKE